MSNIADIADRYVDQLSALDPIVATRLGVAGHDDELTDYSPAGAEARAELDRRTLAEIAECELADDSERVAADVMSERLHARLDQHDAQEHFRALRVLGSPVGGVRQCFDLMARADADDWGTIARRMAAVPDALARLRLALDEGRRRGIVAARRQALACAEQAATWGGVDVDKEPFFVKLVGSYDVLGLDDAALRRELETSAELATAAYAELCTYLRAEYAPKASETDATGPDRYALFARTFLGSAIDAIETYEWGWQELHRIEHAIAEVAERIRPGASVAEVVHYLEQDPNRSIEGPDKFLAWNQGLIDRTIDELADTHFEIPAPLRRVEAMIAPPGGAAAMYYTPPSEDFSRPGRTWYPTLGKTTFPTWKEVSICYHEAVPGHHLQLATTVHRRETLTRFQRLLGFTSGHGEGWALYAERLMAELGYLDDPAFELGMLAAQAFRAARVVVDIGLHLELPIPADERDNPGKTWTAALALPFMIEHSRQPDAFMSSEVDRYLGLPAQAISYKVGERVWLGCRADAQRRHGTDFDLKAFHTHALNLGGMGLDLLADQLARF